MKAIGDWVGRLIGDRYELKKHLFASNFSNVFTAQDLQNNCLVVVKISINRSQFDTLVDRLKREAEALQELDHPGIVRFIDSGKLGKMAYFLVLEFIKGEDLHTALKLYRSFSVDDCIMVLVQMLEALHDMHQKNMIHRDIKSPNVMISPKGAKIIDLGLVKFLSDSNPFRKPTPTGSLIGTWLYASPEPAMGMGGHDCRSDLYSCGVVLYEILTNSLPFYDSGECPEEWDDYWNHLRPFSKTYGVPKELQEIIWKALSVDPGLRYQTAEEMRLALLAVRPFSFKRSVGGWLGRVWGWFWY